MPYRSSEELFEAVRDFIGRLEAKGLTQAAAQLAQGLGCLNGLTDGWALFLESVERVQTTHGDELSSADRGTLEEIRKAAHTAVHRR